MSLIKRNEANWLPSVFDDMFKTDWIGGTTNENSIGTSIPAVNIQENDEMFRLEVAAPGKTREDFNIELDNDVLTISAEEKRKMKIPKGMEGLPEKNSATAISKEHSVCLKP